ncbi:MAG: lipoyl synthase [Spirochaetales bacterium]|nr:lipoyl synthase [Spirochaetales bacterium]
MSSSQSSNSPIRKPEWLKITHRREDEYREIRLSLRSKGLHTVCEEAACPNLNECWSKKTATLMILGDTCTRGCRFCHVKTGHPKGFIDPTEIDHAAEMVALMKLDYLVLTSVDRDDLPDHGAGHFAAIINRIKRDFPSTKIEALVPDFGGDTDRMKIIVDHAPLVVAQNMETVKRLTHPVRDIRAGYELTLHCLDFYKKSGMRTKTSLMVGLGETIEELEETMKDLRSVGVDVLTFGQYLQPTKAHWPISRYYSPREFSELQRTAYKLGFAFVASGPLVRSSYKASDYLAFVEGKHKEGENHD